MSSCPPIESLPEKQRQTLEKLTEFLQENGYPPSIQQLCDLCGVSSKSTIHHHLTALKKKGFINWNSQEKRSISVHQSVVEEESTGLPILGSIAAGQPLMTISDDTERLDLSQDLCSRESYILRVRGTSMIEDHIMDGDMVIVNPKARVRDGDIVVALIEDNVATLKRMYREKDGVRLQPANSEMEPIFTKDVIVQGKVEAVLRQV